MNPRPASARAVRVALSATVGLTLTVLLSVLLPAVALADDSGGEPVDRGGGAAMLRIGLITLGLFVVISLLAALPRLLTRPRYRPGKPWPYDPLWFAGPENPDAALSGARALRGTGGASGDW